MKEIKLSKKGKYAGIYVALVDDEDYERVNQYNWSVSIDKKNIYALRKIRIPNNKFKTIKLHHFILGKKQGFIIDHEDRNGLNNQKSNLRHCTNTDNQKNRRASGSSKYLGVSWNKNENIWTSKIRIKGKNKYLGSFKNELDAANAYNESAKIHHGKFANLNII